MDGLHDISPTEPSGEGVTSATRAPLRAAAAMGMAAEDRATLTGVSRKLQQHQAAAAAGPGTRLRLVPVGVSGTNPTLAAEPNSLTQYHASRI